LILKHFFFLRDLEFFTENHILIYPLIRNGCRFHTALTEDFLQHMILDVEKKAGSHLGCVALICHANWRCCSVIFEVHMAVNIKIMVFRDAMLCRALRQT
jgi:hypothetical protein